MSAKIKESQRLAELKAWAPSLKKKRALEEAKLKLRLEEEELELESEIMVAVARYKATEEIESVSQGQEITFSPQHEDERMQRKANRFSYKCNWNTSI